MGDPGHSLVLDNESYGMGTGCSRCGATSRDDLAKPCTAASDGKIYSTQNPNIRRMILDAFDVLESDDARARREKKDAVEYAGRKRL